MWHVGCICGLQMCGIFYIKQENVSIAFESSVATLPVEPFKPDKTLVIMTSKCPHTFIDLLSDLITKLNEQEI